MRKVPFIPQFNTTECGACVLTMILHYFGAFHSLQEVRQQMSITRDGVTIRTLINTFGVYGITAVAYRGVLNRNSDFQLPAIVTWEGNHYVVLEKLGDKFVHIVDSNIGRIKMSYEEFYKCYSGIIVLLEKTDKFRKVRREYKFKNSFSDLIAVYKYKIVFLMFLTFLSHSFSVAIPIIIQQLIDNMFGGVVVTNYFALLIIAILLSAFFNYLKGYHISVLGVMLDRDVNTGIISKLLRVAYDFYDKKSNAEILYALDNISCIKGIYLNNLVDCLFNLVTIIFILFYLSQENFMILVTVVLVLLPNILMLVLTDMPMQRDLKIMMKEQSYLSGYQVEMIYSILGIKSSCVETSIFHEWQEKYDIFYHNSRKYEIKLNLFNVVLSTLLTLSPVVVLVVSVMYIQKGFISIGAALSCYAMTDVLFNSTNVTFNTIRSFRNNTALLGRLEDIMQYQEERFFDNSQANANKNGDIILDHVSFKYSQESKSVIENISFRVPKNSKVAIVGSSGSGKSTLLKVIAGLYRADGGDILYNGNQLGCGEGRNLRKEIGFVAQNMWLMNKSILENLTMGLSKLTMDEVQRACKIVNIHDEIQRMPMGYQTIVSETGKNISGGQCQRIILARMVLLKPKVLLLDEATSALDIINEKKVLDYFYQAECTIIMVTHKLELLKMCDKIIVMREGEMCCEGVYEDLIESCIEFLQLLK